MKKTAPTVVNVNRDRLSLCSFTHLAPVVFKFLQPGFDLDCQCSGIISG
jgi:hypothetical protein